MVFGREAYEVGEWHYLELTSQESLNDWSIGHPVDEMTGASYFYTMALWPDLVWEYYEEHHLGASRLTHAFITIISLYLELKRHQ